ncbi:MAG: AAA family ATPase [Phycisphaerales bacterium]|nr:AAA family ATPase [Phycisphaerales bacterium]
MRFEDGGGYCSRCKYTEGATGASYNGDVDTMTQFNDVKDLPIKALKDRGIDQDVCQHYGVHTEFDERSGKPVAYYYPFTIDGNITCYKKRTLPKEFSAVGESIKGRCVDFIGQSVAGSNKKLLITEGQDDMLAAFQMLWRSYPKLKPSVVSLPNGANIKAFADNKDFIAKFSEVIFCPDNDDAGAKVVKDIAALHPGVKFMSISEKDGNDMLLKGKGREFINAFFKAAPFTPAGFVTVADVFDEATAMPRAGRPWPWPSLNKLTYGRRDGEGTYFGAGVKMGKSEVVNQIAHYDTQVLGDKIALFKLEEKPAMTVRKVAGKIAHKQFHIPDGDFTQQELIDGVKAVGDRVILYDSYGSTAWDDLKVAIRHSVVVEGVKTVIIDPLTRLTTGMDSASSNTELERVADEISKMAKDLGFHYIFLCHLKAPQTGKPHENGGKVRSNQFTGSRAMMRACYFMIGIERDKTCEDEVRRNTSSFVLLEDRAFGNVGSFDVYYNRETGDYLEPSQEFI